MCEVLRSFQVTYNYINDAIIGGEEVEEHDQKGLQKTKVLGHIVDEKKAHSENEKYDLCT